MNWLLNMIGILIYFINRYANRTKKTVAFNIKFWIRDNWPEFTTVILSDIALMILLLGEGTLVNFDDLLGKLPFGLSVAGEPLLAFLLGLGLSSLFYKFFKHKVKNAKNG
jgi:hypothetical protein